MKKVLVCALAVFFLMASCSTAFAATANSVTTYKDGDTSQFTVTTTVTGAAEDDEVTYLAYKTSKADGNLVYVDQKTAPESGIVTFTFDATPADVAATSVQLGTDSATPVTPATEALNTRTVTITVNGASPASVVLPEEIAENSFFYVSGLTIPSGKVVDCALIGTTEIAAMSAADGKVILAEDALITDDAEIDLQLRDVTTGDITITNVCTAKFNDGGVDKLTVYAILTGVNTEEYGINLKIGEAGTPEKYQAVAMGTNGEFAVQIIDENEGLVDADYYANVYAGIVESEYVLVPVVE